VSPQGRRHSRAQPHQPIYTSDILKSAPKFAESLHTTSKKTYGKTKRGRTGSNLGVIADELDPVARVDGGGAEPALLQPHRAASFVGTALPARIGKLTRKTLIRRWGCKFRRPNSIAAAWGRRRTRDEYRVICYFITQKSELLRIKSGLL
jgi:hypothetical protein